MTLNKQPGRATEATQTKQLLYEIQEESLFDGQIVKWNHFTTVDRGILIPENCKDNTNIIDSNIHNGVKNHIINLGIIINDTIDFTHQHTSQCARKKYILEASSRSNVLKTTIYKGGALLATSEDKDNSKGKSNNKLGNPNL